MSNVDEVYGVHVSIFDMWLAKSGKLDVMVLTGGVDNKTAC